jgi:glutamine---fructose-6-phosphate transaminase (isomerizing)
VAALVDELRARDARVLVIGPGDGVDVRVPADMPEGLAPIAAVVRAQQIARFLALALGRDPDAPAGLSKVTVT